MLTDILKLVRSERQQVCKQARREQRADDRFLHGAFVLYVETGCALEAPSELVNQHGSTFGGDLRALLEEQLSKTSVEEHANFDCTGGQLRPTVARATEIFFKKWPLARWVGQVDEDAGTAPDIAACEDRLDPALPTSDDQSVPKAGTVRKWIGHWCRRWKAKLGRVQTQCGRNVELVSRKVCVLESKKKRKKVRFFGPNFGPIFRAQGGAPFTV